MNRTNKSDGHCFGNHRSHHERRYDDRLNRRISFRSIIRDYQKCWLPDSEFERFRKMPSLIAAIEAAALSLKDGEIHPHQFKCGKPVADFAKAADALCASVEKIENCGNFDHDLLKLIENVLQETFPRSNKQLYAYDIAFRIAAYLDTQRPGLLPVLIHLHCGVIKGAKALHIPIKGKRAIAVSELPKEFHQLPAWQLENILCICHKKLSEAMTAGTIVRPHRSRCRKSRRFTRRGGCSMPLSAVAPATHCLS